MEYNKKNLDGWANHMGEETYIISGQIKKK